MILINETGGKKNEKYAEKIMVESSHITPNIHLHKASNSSLTFGDYKENLASAHEDTVFARVSLLADTVFARITHSVSLRRGGSLSCPYA